MDDQKHTKNGGFMKHNKFEIPTTFNLGFRNIDVWYDPQQIYGKTAPVGLNNLGTGDIYLQTPVKDKLDEETIYQTFFHELCHGILYSMGEQELTHNERFVDGFAHLLTQFELTKKGDLLKTWKNDLEKEANKKAKKEAKKAVTFKEEI